MKASVVMPIAVAYASTASLSGTKTVTPASEARSALSSSLATISLKWLLLGAADKSSSTVNWDDALEMTNAQKRREVRKRMKNGFPVKVHNSDENHKCFYCYCLLRNDAISVIMSKQ